MRNNSFAKNVFKVLIIWNFRKKIMKRKCKNEECVTIVIDAEFHKSNSALMKEAREKTFLDGIKKYWLKNGYDYSRNELRVEMFPVTWRKFKRYWAENKKRMYNELDAINARYYKKELKL